MNFMSRRNRRYGSTEWNLDQSQSIKKEIDRNLKILKRTSIPGNENKKLYEITQFGVLLDLIRSPPLSVKYKQRKHRHIRGYKRKYSPTTEIFLVELNIKRETTERK